MGTEKRSQKTQILNWMQHGYTITPKDAIELCQCYRLLGRVDEEGGLTNDAFK